MYGRPGGVGLAAPMLGVGLRMVVAAASDARVLVMCDPHVVGTGRANGWMREANLCMPGVIVDVERPLSVTVQWEDLAGTRRDETFDGWTARILQHEIELLDGRVFTDLAPVDELTDLSAAQQSANAVAHLYREHGSPEGIERMHLLNVITLPPELISLEESILRRPAEPVDVASLDPTMLRTLLGALFQTQYDRRGVGLAAPQVGLSMRIAVIDDGAEPPLALINPTILEASSEHDTLAEGCLSIPGWRGAVDRPTAVCVRNHTVTGEPFEFEATGFLARVIQHEIDHLDGVLYPDHLGEGEELSRVDPETRADAALASVYASAAA